MVRRQQNETAAVGYIRVSSEEQARGGISLDAQVERIKAYAAMRGLELVAIYREEGVSGKVALKRRPEGSKVVEALRSRKARHVIAVKLDRLFRSTVDALAQSEAWDRQRIALHIIDMAGHALDTTSALGKMFLTLCAGFAEMERNLTSERTKTALSHLKSSGAAYCHITPLGFDRQGGRLVENPAEMETVRLIFALRAQGMGLRGIADELNRRRTPTKRGGIWRVSTLQSVLRVHAPLGRAA
jgi:DNA invertase Pin-like site-specific DNA recombinase